jgi:hypothetical protein
MKVLIDVEDRLNISIRRNDPILNDAHVLIGKIIELFANVINRLVPIRI